MTHGAWFAPDMILGIEAKQFKLGFIRPVYLVSNSLGVIEVLFAKSKQLSCVFL